MTDLTKYLLEETKLHPSLAPQDVVKLCYQAAFGAEHMLSDHSKALKYFQDEYAAAPEDDKALFESIAPTVCRANLSAWKRLQLNPDWLWNLFLGATSGKGIMQKDSKVFTGYILQADKLCQLGKFPFSYEQWQEYIFDYTKSKPDNLPPVRHSAAYRDKERPAYRILSGQDATILPIFKAMAGMGKGIIAIDGRAASGKSTLAGYLRNIISAEVIAMDDFFLPPELRTPERLVVPGGNIHHERFAHDVLPSLRSGQGFTYNGFDCSRMEYSSTPTKILPSLWRIVEGVYSCHPAFGDYMDIRVFMDVHSAEQKSRIETRNHPKIAADYFAKWIPMEETYFKEYKIRESANVIIQT